MISIIRWLLGYVKFTFLNGFTEGFINDCFKNNLNIKDIAETENGITASADIKTYFRLHRIAFRHGGRVKAVKRKGLPFFLHPLKNRWGILVGMAFSVFLISFMGGFIWNVTVVGNDRVTDAKIVDYLACNGFKTGMRWSDTDKENLEFGVMAEFDEVSWISINKIGSLALVEINETRDKPNITDNSKITNVVAEDDGIIIHVTALGGWSQVKAGDAVSKGDLLISGVNESEVDEKNHFAHAHGTVLANVNTTLSLNISREQKDKDFYKSAEYKSLFFFGIKIPLYFKAEQGDFDENVSRANLVYNHFRLPIGIETKKCEYYNVISNRLSDETLEELARSELEKLKADKLKNAEIISENVEVEMQDNVCIITGSYNIVKNIGTEQEILFEDE